MPSFNEIKTLLGKQESSVADLTRQQAMLRENLAASKRELDALERRLNPDDDQATRQKTRLQKEIGTTVEKMEQTRAAIKNSAGIRDGLRNEFNLFTDPRQNIAQLNDDTPILLLPVRMETRFKKTLIRGAVSQDQLWLRIFPDDCAVDTFEETLSEAEVKNAKFFWQDWFAAGGQEAGERAAWRGLVSSHGSGRAGYIIKQYIPVNITALPVKAGADDVLLVISCATLPSAAAQSALSTLYTMLWLKSGDIVAENSALAAFNTGMGADAPGLLEGYRPYNFALVPRTGLMRADVEVKTVFLQLPDDATIPTKLQSWTQAPKVYVMPEKFVVTGYVDGKPVFDITSEHPLPYPLIVGPDPSANTGDQLVLDEAGNMVVSEDIKWMVDFEESVKKGLGFKIDLTEQQAARGFDRIIALGVKLSADESEGKELVQQLLTHHLQSTKGLLVLKQGTPTNNTEADGAGFQRKDDPDESFQQMKQGAAFIPSGNVYEKKDGQWLADGLGIGYELMNMVPNAGFTDQQESRLMNVALWPATMGYMMETMMQPVFSQDVVDHTRDFFNRYVQSQGLLPAIRIGKQPYGILPTAPFSRLAWMTGRHDQPAVAMFNTRDSFLQNLYGVIRLIDEDFNKLRDRPSYVGKAGQDAGQMLVDSLGLTPSSIDYYQRTAMSQEELYNRSKIKGLGNLTTALFQAATYQSTGMSLLMKLGYKPAADAAIPDVLTKSFLRKENKLKGSVIDDRPLSETDPIRAYTVAPGSLNYIGWLMNAAKTSHAALNAQQGFIDNQPPSALLYLLLHHALDLSFVEVSLLLFQKASLLTSSQAMKMKMEPAFLHVATAANETESRWKYLYQANEVVTGNADRLLGDHIPKIIKQDIATKYLGEQLDALEVLRDLPTARLERLFAGHLDTCSYRIDAWRNAILGYQLGLMRGTLTGEVTAASNTGAASPIGNTGAPDPVGNAGAPDPVGNAVAPDPTRKEGLYIGAFGVLEHVRSENKTLTPVGFQDPELIKNFTQDGEPRLMKDNTNAGYLMAPSLNQAVTASILRNAYVANGQPDALRINLSSERIRKALAIIEGIRGGQSLGALLGYYFERRLHDGYPGIELDLFIHLLRKAYPLVANRMKDTLVNETSDTTIDSVEAIAARNVVDGYLMLEKIRESNKPQYPFDKSFLPAANPAQAAAINDAVQQIMDLNDAVADLAMAESVHQIVQGNYDRGAGTLDAYSKGNFPPTPDVIQTPRSGITLTHRVGLQFLTGLDPATETGPRAQAEPAMNRWLQGVLPSLSNIACQVSYGTVMDEEVNMVQLALQPIDLLYLIDTGHEQAMNELDDRIERFVLSKPGIRPDTKVIINYLKAGAGRISIFETSALIRSLRGILLRSRSLVPTDIMLPGQAKEESNQQQFLEPARIELRYTRLNQLVLIDLKNLNDELTPLVADPVTNRALLLSNIDDYTSRLIAIGYEMSGSGLSQGGYGSYYERRRMIYSGLIERISTLVEKWDKKLLAFDGMITDYDALPGTATDDERFALLGKARLEISTLLPLALPPLPATYRTQLLSIRAIFVIKQTSFRDILTIAPATINGLVAAVNGAMPVSDYDLDEPGFIQTEEQVIQALTEFAQKTLLLAADLTKRLASARIKLDEAATATIGKKQVDAILEATKFLFHEDMKLIPSFDATPQQAAEWSNCIGGVPQLLSHPLTLSSTPVDDWLSGLGRVREKMHHWENVLNLTDAFETDIPELLPVQFPFKATDNWLALEYPDTMTIDNDKLLYTANYATPFVSGERQCGLLVDEWSEVIPVKSQTAGIGFHFDRPNSEAPQCWLLAMPAQFKGSWSWTDLVDCVLETLEMSRKRAIEPEHIGETDYARFLPALLSSMVTAKITPSLNLSINNAIYSTHAGTIK